MFAHAENFLTQGGVEPPGTAGLARRSWGLPAELGLIIPDYSKTIKENARVATREGFKTSLTNRDILAGNRLRDRGLGEALTRFHIDTLLSYPTSLP